MARKDLKCFTKLCGNLYYKMSDGVLARCLGVGKETWRSLSFTSRVGMRISPHMVLFLPLSNSLRNWRSLAWLFHDVFNQEIRRNKIRLHDWSVKEHQERGSDLTSSDYGSFDLPTNILMVSIACHVMVTDHQLLSILNAIFRSLITFWDDSKSSHQWGSGWVRLVPFLWSLSSYSVNEAGIGAGSLSPIPDQITSQKNEQRMEGSIEPRNGKPGCKAGW